jgi:hypothetical protein
MIHRIYGLLGACICLLSFVVSNAQSDVKVVKYDAKKALKINPFIKDYSQLPIKPERTISFTTDEGSYMDVDVSPDGKLILFDLLGEMFVMPVKGGNARQLTRGLA